MIRVHQIVLFNLLYDKICSWSYWLSTRSPTTVTFSSVQYSMHMCLPFLCFQSVQFLKTNILQGSVATPFISGGVCNDLFIANFPQSVTMKGF